eukprot:TRINITY_DN1702_c0_g1_i1.p1 TRINITY_DN1702_c0_g1~~TRINITY_DN1702_c0_g1_i1.p1  ORF type:complete len:101 (-),score=31.63 TRINITY_DN1702_c0_g1_i1:177-479(-)
MNKFNQLMSSPAGPKTVFFWAPMMKWGLVFAGIADLKKHPEYISIPQSTALALTGFIWARYSTQIIPFNYNLLAVNFFVGLTGVYQLSRKFIYEQSKKNN